MAVIQAIYYEIPFLCNSPNKLTGFNITGILSMHVSDRSQPPDSFEFQTLTHTNPKKTKEDARYYYDWVAALALAVLALACCVSNNSDA